MRRARFQHGWLTTKTRKTGETWYYNFREYNSAGEAVQRSKKIGTVKQYPTEADALRKVLLQRIDVNRQVTDSTPGPLLTVEMLVGHFRQHELEAVDDQEEGRASTTRDTYESYLQNYIVPQWGKFLLGEVKAVAVEHWLRNLRRIKGKMMAKGTKAKIRNILHALYTHAVRHEFIDRNPINEVRQSAKRERIPDILDVEEFQALYSELETRERAMVMMDAGSGLRRGELFALKWEDIDWKLKQAGVHRSIVHNTKKRLWKCKSETSRRPVPLDDFMLEELEAWKKGTVYSRNSDWVFASPASNGDWPYWPQTIMVRVVRPAAVAAKVTKRIGWHTFRHSYTSLLKANGEDVKVVQELLRHANSRITMDTYAQAMTPAKRQAQSNVVQMLRPKAKAAGEGA